MRIFSIKTVFLAVPFVFLALFLLGSASASKKTSLKSSNRDVEAVNWAKEKLSTLTLEEKIAQFFMVSAYSNQGEKHLKEVELIIRDEKVGGVIFFQGEKSNFSAAVKRFQQTSSVPLFIAMDAEWGSHMRLFDGERFPYAYTLGAADDLESSKKVAIAMAQECRELGIHMNFSPDADVNSDPNNPVIGFRSFGEDPGKVASHVRSFVQGFEENGVMACLKHFPGHGNTDKDSHFELPTISRSLNTLEMVDLKPFKEGIAAGASSVMIAHLNVPSLDKSGLPTSLSKIVIQENLKEKLQFKGLIISDALNMKAVADKYGKSDVVVKAFEAGCDILLCPESVKDAIKAIKEKVNQGEITKTEIDERCLKLLKYKYLHVITPKLDVVNYSKDEINSIKQSVFDKALTVLKNQENVLPIGRLNKKIVRISIGMHTSFFRDAMDLFADVESYHYFTLKEAVEDLPEKVKSSDIIIYSLHANTVRPKNNFGFGPEASESVSKLPKAQQNILVLFGNPLFLTDKVNLSGFQSVVVAYENNSYSQKSAAQFVFGAMEANGKLPVTVSENFKKGFGLSVAWGGRLKFSQPEELGIKKEKLEEIDAIANNAIAKGAFPGCQIVVAVKGKIIYRKAFGKQTYEGVDSVGINDVYDIASVSKIAGSTAGIMKLQSEGRFSLSKKLSDYIPEITGDGEYGNIVIREMMAHQAGLTPWIPFYKRTLKNGELDPSIYSSINKAGFEKQVANNLFIKNTYTDTLYRQILSTPLGQKKYEYSDLGYYFIKKIIEKETKVEFQQFLTDELYIPMGLRYLRYEPLKYFPVSQIVPTENDQAFRKQLVHGYVHDPGAAMLGGVGGHAGLFSNATDLASLMQLFLNKGNYGSHQFISSNVVEEFTKSQCPGNRRGAGFDRPSASGGGPCCEAASQMSFGHSGFTGTLVWADPQYGINYVFLSNRVCPDQGNWKIRDMNIRTEIQRVIYEAVKSAK
jgi:beta-glucosidase-like glycosyl hydrolase/CubicO group peptidase (beta-lactamase class C family)